MILGRRTLLLPFFVALAARIGREQGGCALDAGPGASLGNMAEWLRRVIRNHLGSPRVGSNPADSALFLFVTEQFRDKC